MASRGSNSRGGGRRNAAKAAPKLQLERVLGMTCVHNSSLAVNDVTGEIAYPAGCIVVVYNPKRNRQVRFFKARQAVSCVCFSPSGQFIAIGERGKKPALRVFQLSTGREVANLQQHAYGIKAAAFSPDDSLVVSIGYEHDRNVHVWDWQRQVRVGTGKVSQQMCAVAISGDGKRMVTCGVRHVKFWSLESLGTDRPTNLAARPGIMAACDQAKFVDVTFGVGPQAGNVYAITSDGTLCCFDDGRVMEMWVEVVKSSSAFALCATASAVAVGCAEGIIRLFDPSNLTFKVSLPRPPPLGCANQGLSAVHELDGCRPATVAVAMTLDSNKVIGVYGDRSLFIWDIKRPSRMTKYRSFMFHSGPVWDVKMAPDVTNAEHVGPLPPDTFVTCSSDSTVRFWNINRKCLAAPEAEGGADTRTEWAHLNNAYGKDLLHVLYAQEEDETHLHGSALIGSAKGSPSKRNTPLAADSLPARAVLRGPFNVETPPKLPVNVGLRCIGMRPGSSDMVVGDRQGTLRVYDTARMRLSSVVLAHESEVMSVDFSPLSGRLLASGSRDRLVHVFDARCGYRLRETLDQHSSSVTGVRFARDDSKLMSCGGDKTIVMCSIKEGADVQGRPGVVRVKRFRSVTVPYGTIYDMVVDATNRHLVTGGQDKHLNVWNLSNGKPLRSYKTDATCQEINRVALDPAGIIAATCSFDKGIRLFDFFTGHRLARVSAHSEMVTGVTFTHDCRRLITTGADGCIMVWRISEDLTRAMKARLDELVAARSPHTAAATAAAQGKAGGAGASATGGAGRASLAKSQRTKLMELLQGGATVTAGSVTSREQQQEGQRNPVTARQPVSGAPSVSPVKQLGSTDKAPRPLAADSPPTTAATSSRGAGVATPASSYGASSFNLDVHKSVLPAWARSGVGSAQGGDDNPSMRDTTSSDTPLIGSPSAGVRTGGFAGRGGAGAKSRVPGGFGPMGREPPAPPTESTASEGKAAPPAVPQSKWDQRLGPDGYELFGGQLKVKPGDDGEGEVLMATLAQSTGGTSIDGDDGDAVGDAQGLEDDGDEDGGDDGDAGDVVEADPSQANLSTASFTVTTDHAALADAIARAAAIRERGGRSPAHDDGVSGGKHEEDDLAQREFKLDAPSADTPARNPLRATLSSTFYRAAVKAGSDGSGGGTVAPPPLPQHDAAPKAVPATSPRGLTGRTGRSDRGSSKPRSSLEQALALKPLDAPPDVSTRSLQQERDAKRKEHAFDRSAASIWDEGKEALSISDLASATPLPKPNAGAVSVGGAAAAELSGRVSPLRDSTAEDVASSLERMLLNATSAAAADAVHASRAADAAALRASIVAQGAVPGGAAATTPGGASAAKAEAVEATASTACGADTGASTPVPAPSPLRDAVRSSTARPSGHATPSRGLTVSPVHAATVGAVALASPGEAPLPQASSSPLRAVDGGRASPAATTPTRRDRNRGSGLPRPLAMYQQSVASLRSALGNVMSLYHELEAASLGAQVGGGDGAADVTATRDAMALMRVSMAEVRQSLVADGTGPGSGSGDLVRPHTAATGLGQQQPTLVAVSSGASQLSLSYARPHTAMGAQSQSQRPGTAASVSTVPGGVNIDVASILEHFSGMLCNAVQQRMGLPAGTVVSAAPDPATAPDAGAGGNDGANA